MWGLIDFTVTASLFFMGIVFAIGWELSSKASRADQLAHELLHKTVEADQLLSAMNLAANAGNVGIWIRNINTGQIWTNSECRKIFCLPKSGDLKLERFHERLHPDDRLRVLASRITDSD